MNIVRSIKIALLAITFTLFSCGGGSSSSPTPRPSPTASPSPDPSSGGSNTAPVFSSQSLVETPENSVDTGYSAVASDTDGDTVTFSLSGEVDDDLFSINSLNGALEFITAPDFENPVDSDGNNVYGITINADDGKGGSTNLPLYVSVSNVNNILPEIYFPPAIANLNGVDEIEIFGNFTDREDGIVDGEEIISISVGSESFQFQNSGNLNWRISFNPELGTGGIGLGLQLLNKNPFAVIYGFTNQEHMTKGVVTLGNENNIFILDSSLEGGRILEIDLDTGNRKIVAESVTRANGMDFNDVTKELLVYGLIPRSLYSVNTETGEFTRLSGLGVGSGPETTKPVRLKFDSPSYSVYMGDYDLDAVIKIELTTGNRLEISSATQGAGPLWDDYSNFPVVLATNPSGIIYVGGVYNNQAAIFTVDMTTGDREILAGPGYGAGEEVTTSHILGSHAMLDLNNNALYLSESGQNKVLSVNLTSGERTILFGRDMDSNMEEYALAFQKNTSDFISLNARDQLFITELISRDKSLVSDASAGGNNIITTPIDIEIDPESRTLYMLNSNGHFVAGIDLNVYPFSATVSGLSVGSGHQLSNGSLLDIDRNNNQLIVWDYSQGLFEIGIDSGTRRLFASAFPEGEPRTMSIDESTDDILVTTEEGKLLSVDRNNGASTLISGPGKGSGPLLPSLISSAVNSAGRVIYLVDWNLGTVYQVNLITGERRILSSNSVGTGSPIISPTDIFFDEIRDILYVTSDATRSIYAIDTVTGDRTEVYGPNTGKGVKYSTLSPNVKITLDTKRNVMYMYDRGTKGIIAMDIETGNSAFLYH